MSIHRSDPVRPVQDERINTGPRRARIPNPGSIDALKLGCFCPVLDNSHGDHPPFADGRWWISPACPVHRPYCHDAR